MGFEAGVWVLIQVGSENWALAFQTRLEHSVPRLRLARGGQSWRRAFDSILRVRASLSLARALRLLAGPVVPAAAHLGGERPAQGRRAGAGPAGAQDRRRTGTGTGTRTWTGTANVTAPPRPRDRSKRKGKLWEPLTLNVKFAAEGIHTHCERVPPTPLKRTSLHF